MKDYVSMIIELIHSHTSLGERAADIFFEEIALARSKNLQIVFILPTGTTPIPMYQAIIKRWQIIREDLSKVIFFNMDEYVGLANDHPGSYYNYMYKNFYNHLIDVKNGICKENIYIPNGISLEDAKKSAKFYRKIFESYLAAEKTQIVCFGGIGQGPAHIAFNDFTEEMAQIPESQRLSFALASRMRVVKLDENTRKTNKRFFAGKLDQVPTHAITVGFYEILKANRIIIMASDYSKQAAIISMFDKEPTYKVPASLLRNHKKDEVRLLLTAEVYSENLPVHPVSQDLEYLKPYLRECPCAQLISLTENTLYSSLNLPIFPLYSYKKRLILVDGRVKNDDPISKFFREKNDTIIPVNSWDEIRKICDEQNFEIALIPQSLSPPIAIPYLNHLLDCRKQILLYENYISRLTSFNVWLEVTQREMEIQKEALRCHISQIRRTPFPEICEQMAVETAADFGKLNASFASTNKGIELFQLKMIEDGFFTLITDTLPVTSFSIARNDQLIVFSPHPDDAEIGMGGFLQFAAQKFSDITVYNMTGGHHVKILIDDILHHPNPSRQLLDYVDKHKHELKEELLSAYHKQAVRQHESASAIRLLNPNANVVGLNLSFYENSYIPSPNDLETIENILSQKYLQAKKYAYNLWIAMPVWADAHTCHRVSTEMVLTVIKKVSQKFKGLAAKLLFYRTPWTGLANAFLFGKYGQRVDALVGSERVQTKGSEGYSLLKNQILDGERAIKMIVYKKELVQK